MVGTWRTIYSLFGWNYPEHPTDKTKQVKREMLIQIRKSKMKLNKTKGYTEVKGQIKPVKVKGFRRKKKKKKRTSSY